MHFSLHCHLNPNVWKIYNNLNNGNILKPQKKKNVVLLKTDPMIDISLTAFWSKVNGSYDLGHETGLLCLFPAYKFLHYYQQYVLNQEYII